MLVAARVGETDRPHLAVRPLLRRQPLDGVVAVLGLQREWIPLTLGVVAAADVLNRDGVPVATEELGGADRGQPLATVRGALQDGREAAGHRAAVPRREVEVGREAHAVPHRHHDAALRAHVVNRGRSLPFRHRSLLAYWWPIPVDPAPQGGRCRTRGVSNPARGHRCSPFWADFDLRGRPPVYKTASTVELRRPEYKLCR